jgi:hypothetical protein
MNNRKTIFVTINRAIVVRNFLMNPAIEILKKKYNIVLLTPQYKDPEFCEKFSDYNIEPLYGRELNFWKGHLEQLFISIHKAMIYNPTIKLRSKYGLMLKSTIRFKYLRNFIERYFFGIFFNWNGPRKLFKYIDAKIFPCNIYNDVIKKYNPVLVFITSLGSDDEVALLRNCKACNIKSVGMAQTWDNLSKFGFREKVDFLVVWSEYMEEEAIKFQTYKKENIRIVGVPQFDYYKKMEIDSKERFFKKFDLNMQKKLIVFGSEGPVCPDDPYIVYVLKEKIKNGILKNYQILIRPHFGYKNDMDRFLEYVDNKIVFIDNDYGFSNFKDGTTMSLKTVKNLIAEIKYSAAFVTSASTLVLDAVANGKQALLYNFDKNKSQKFGDSIKRLYTSLWFKEIFKIGLDNIVKDEDDLVNKIEEISQNNNKDIDKRKKLIKRFCYKIDGKSSERLFGFIDEYIKNKLEYDNI